jgi:anthranilate phosphoribosyltransferase
MKITRGILRAARSFVEGQPGGEVWMYGEGSYDEKKVEWVTVIEATWDGEDESLVAKAIEMGWKPPEPSNPYDTTGKTPEEIAELVHDKLQGGPRKRMADYAYELGATYHEVLERAKNYAEGGEYWSEGGRFEGQGLYKDFWSDYELITGETVPQDMKHNFFSCSC